MIDLYVNDAEGSTTHRAGGDVFEVNLRIGWDPAMATPLYNVYMKTVRVFYFVAQIREEACLGGAFAEIKNVQPRSTKAAKSVIVTVAHRYADELTPIIFAHLHSELCIRIDENASQPSLFPDDKKADEQDDEGQEELDYGGEEKEPSEGIEENIVPAGEEGDMNIDLTMPEDR